MSSSVSLFEDGNYTDKYLMSHSSCNILYYLIIRVWDCSRNFVLTSYDTLSCQEYRISITTEKSLSHFILNLTYLRVIVLVQSLLLLVVIKLRCNDQFYLNRFSNLCLPELQRHYCTVVQCYIIMYTTV